MTRSPEPRPTVAPPEPARGDADVVARIARGLAGADDTPTALAAALTTLALEVVPGARWVSVTRGLSERFTTVAASHPVAESADLLQYRLGTGPCIDAVIDDHVFESDDLALDRRWSWFGPQVSRDLGVRSVLSIRIVVGGSTPQLNAALNLYGDHIAAFGPASRRLAMLVATRAAGAVNDDGPAASRST